MTELEIMERLILAAEIEDRGGRVGPAPLRAQRLPYVHSQADMNGWGKRPGERDQLRKEDADAHSAHRDRFFSSIPDDQRSLSEAEEAWGWLALVSIEAHRVALAAWAGCMADNKRRFFKDWCKRQGISEKTGRRRKDTAVASIRAHLTRNDVQNYDIRSGEGLLDTPQISDVVGRIGDAWRPNAYWLTASAQHPEFDWSDKRNARRRQRDATRRKREAA